LALGAFIWEVTVVVTKWIFIPSAPFGSTHSTGCTPSLGITLTPKLIGASLKTICAWITGLVVVETTGQDRGVVRKEKECEGQEAYHGQYERSENQLCNQSLNDSLPAIAEAAGRFQTPPHLL
jgi:hypothetical protein